jgi:hypothetical protein
LNAPFELNEHFEVAATHANQLFAAEKAILIGSSYVSTDYAKQNEIGICEARHSPKLDEDEW